MAECQVPRAQIERLFFVFTYIWQEDAAKIPKVSSAPGNNNVRRISHLLRHFSTGTIHLHLANFYETKYF